MLAAAGTDARLRGVVVDMVGVGIVIHPRVLIVLITQHFVTVDVVMAGGGRRFDYGLKLDVGRESWIRNAHGCVCDSVRRHWMVEILKNKVL